ncbi:class I SAM-dependent methyltransferase [Sulfurimonas marina]|uniref:Methyltransferase domain-containing protein n=1 Tax=Sulfurimonas marina TaxID=2590551 RepID=A0A7M1AVI0_9BACT|nr:class I SAM-dependent methyltransferase [Sulfurimonas marina]QOP41471.1 methyltransferase domain-containing protein [Sulfurimonas marina]
MKSNTLDYYNKNASNLYERYNSADMTKVHKVLDKHINGSDKVLDIGFGSGRDLLHLKRRGITGWGVDGSKSFINLFTADYQSFKERIFHSVLPSLNLSDEFKEFFSVIYSIATWMHLPKEEHFEAILNIKKYLKPGGKVIISYSITTRENDPRYFEDINQEQLSLLFETFGFSLVETTTSADGLGRNNITWITQVFQYTDISKKGIDQIESILSQDSKDSTYKFALLRSFAQIASSPLNRFASFKEGYVFFPIGMIVEKWIEAYWKLMENTTFIPQRNGEEKSAKKLAFRKTLENAIDTYNTKNKNNSYYSFYNEFQNGIASNTEEYDIVRNLVNTIINTIISGPVKYSGSSFDDQSFFIVGNGAKSFPKKNLSINPKSLIDSCTTIGIKQDAYYELYRYGSWIEDSITLRWARFTENLSKISGSNISSGDIVTLLSKDYEVKRDTQLARKIYDKYKKEHGELRSVWSSDKISSYEVDHVLPYSIYSNNDLWNLLPASKQENNTKSDKLVSSELLHKQKNQIITYWEYVKDNAPDRFEHEIYSSFNLDPISESWKDKLILAVSEQLEITSSIRGLKRWSI